MENITSSNAAMGAQVPQSSIFGTPDMNDEKNIVDFPQVCVDARQNWVTRHALSDAAHSFALLTQFIENELTQDSKALTEKTLEVFHGPYLDRVAHV